MLRTAKGLKQYHQVRVDADVSEADPHRLVQLLYLGFLERVAQAKGLIDANNIEAKGKVISEAMGIVQYLRGTLDMEQGGEIANNLGDLYEYIERRLLEANLNNDKDILNELSGLVVEIKAGWDVISS